jgi:hypothetical protein
MYGGNVPSVADLLNTGGNLQNDVGNLAPLATTWSGSIQSASRTFQAPAAPAPQGVGKVTNFFTSAVSSIGHLAESAGAWAGRQLVGIAAGVEHLGAGLGHGIVDHLNLSSINQQNEEMSAKLDTLHNLFKSGRITAAEYKSQLNDHNQVMDNLTREASALNGAISQDYKETMSGLASTTTTLLTILTAGFGKAASVSVDAIPLETKTAGDFLLSQATKPFMEPVENLINHIATNPQAMAKLTDAAAIQAQRAAAEVAATGARMSSGQIARATVANLALKYPITYGLFNPSAQQFYNSLDNKKYGAAVQTLGYNSAILLAGGALGYAWKFGGKALNSVSSRTFGNTQFFDELSKFYQGNFREAASKIASSLGAGDRAEFIKNMSAWEATSVHATGGDVIAAARRVSEGQTFAYGRDTRTMTAEQEINRAVTHMKWQREADMQGKIDGKVYTVGRMDPANANSIAAYTATATNEQEFLNLWDRWKAANPQLAAANNSSLDQQMKDIARKYGSDATSRDTAIRDIKAQFEMKGWSATKRAAAANDGYMLIKPVETEAPFREGSGVLKSSAATGGDFWVKSVQPVPILSHLGTMLTKMGLSPNASTQQVYQVFNDYFGKNLVDSGLSEFKAMEGESLHQTTDTLIKQASAYMYDVNRKGLFNKTPINDLRQMTTKDWMKATGKTESEAKAIQLAAAKSHVQVPLAIKGMGEKLVDLGYATKPTAFIGRRYLRLQAALRYTINPFFQYLRLIPKNEILSEAHGGGYVNSIFQGRLKQLGETRNNLRQAGYFATDEHGLPNTGFSTTGEATDFSGVSVNGRPRKLLSAQEKSISGLVDAQAQKMGMNSADYIKAYSSQLDDTIQSIVGYSKQSNFLNSPLARTLNIAIFPFRFETKVAMALGNKLAETGLLTKVAFIKGLYNAHDFLTSPEGQAWYQENANVIGLLEYVTPIKTFNEVFNSLLPGHDHSLGNFGELGGLPLGWLAQILDAEGLTHFNQPAADSKTGEMYKQYIPITARGQLAVAIQDFISSVFSYPGAQIGLPSKTKATAGIADYLTNAKTSTDFSSQTPPASPQQQAYARAVGVAPTAPQGTIPSVAQLSVNPGPSQLTAPKAASSGSPKSPKKKKADFRPQLLPGQSTLGQL